MKGEAGGNGWLVPLADLSLILFVITGSGLAGMANEQREPAYTANAAANAAEGIASAVFAAGESENNAASAALAQWLAQHPPGPGEQLTVLGTYRTAARRTRVLAQCENLAALAQAAGFAPRVIVQQGDGEQVLAYFANDRIAPVARDLLPDG